MKRICNTCGNLGFVSYTDAQGRDCPPRACHACSPAKPECVCGLPKCVCSLPIVHGSTLTDEPRYRLEKRTQNGLATDSWRWFTTLRTDNLEAIQTKLAEHLEKGASVADFRVIDLRQ